MATATIDLSAVLKGIPEGAWWQFPNNLRKSLPTPPIFKPHSTWHTNAEKAIR